VLNRDELRRLVIPNEPLLNTALYSRVERATAPTAWRAILVYHLLPHENGNQHNIFIDCLDTGGRWARADEMQVGWTWEGRREHEPAPARPFEKRPPEPRAQVDLYARQVTSVWIQDNMGVPSDRVHGLRSDVEDVPGNNLFHNSFFCIFQLMTREVAPPPVVIAPGPDEPQQPTLTLEQRVAATERAIAELAAWRRSMEGD